MAIAALIGTAKRPVAGPQGHAVGIDPRRAEDQTANMPTVAADNARIEGVAERLRIDRGDARPLPYADGNFDVVLSHWVVHNLESAEDRMKVMDETLRVLRPGGVIALAHIAFVSQYREHLQSREVAQLPSAACPVCYRACLALRRLTAASTPKPASTNA